MVHWYGDKTSSGCDVIYLFVRTTGVNLLCLFTHVRGSFPIKIKYMLDILRVIFFEKGGFAKRFAGFSPYVCVSSGEVWGIWQH